MKKYNVTVKKEYLDKYTGLKRKPGDKLEMTDMRIRELRHSGDLVDVGEEVKIPKQKQETKPEQAEKK